MKRNLFVLMAFMALLLTVTSCVSTRGSGKGGGCFATKGMVGY